MSTPTLTKRVSLLICTNTTKTVAWQRFKPPATRQLLFINYLIYVIEILVRGVENVYLPVSLEPTPPFCMEACRPVIKGRTALSAGTRGTPWKKEGRKTEGGDKLKEEKMASVFIRTIILQNGKFLFLSFSFSRHKAYPASCSTWSVSEASFKLHSSLISGDNHSHTKILQGKDAQCEPQHR